MLVVVMLMVAVVGCESKQHVPTQAEQTLNLAVGPFGPIISDAFLLMDCDALVAQHVTSELIFSQDLSRRERVRIRLKERIEGMGAGDYRRFILGQDDTTRIVLRYPELVISREAK